MRAGEGGERREAGGEDGDVHAERVIIVRLDDAAVPIRHDAVVPQMVFQLPEMQINETAAKGHHRGVIAGIGVDHLQGFIFDAVIRCIFRARGIACRRDFHDEELFPVSAVNVFDRITGGRDIMQRQVHQVVCRYVERVILCV